MWNSIKLKLKSIFNLKTETENMLELNFVIPGWYVENSTIDSEKKKIIRVLGGGKKSPNHFKLMDGREMHEQEILDQYTYMPTSTNVDGIGIDSNVDLSGIDDEIQETTDEVIESSTVVNNQTLSENNNHILQYQTSPNQVRLGETHSNNIKTDNLSGIVITDSTTVIETKSEDDIFVDKLLSKFYVSNKQNIDIPVKFEFNYDLEKLRIIADTMDTDSIHNIVNRLITNNLQDIRTLLEQSLIEYLTNQANINLNKSNIVISESTNQKDIEPVKQQNFKSYTNPYLKDIF